MERCGWPIQDFADDVWLSSWRPIYEARRQRARDLAQSCGQSLADFAQGHQYFGLHRDQDGGWIYRDWAPYATALHLVGDFSAWQRSEEYAAQSIGDGKWEIRLPAIAIRHGQHYRVRMTWPEGEGDRLPAWGRRVVQDAHTLEFTAQVWDEEPYIWKHRVPDLVVPPLIYEAHVGMSSEEEKVSTWNEFRLHMLPRIAGAGYNTLQLMAVQEHPYYGSFGYHVGSFFAPSSRFGTANELKQLVDAAHGMGLRVIMDLVHSHAVKNAVEGISCYDGSPYQFFHNGSRGNHDIWDSRCFDYAKPQVRHFLLSNIRYWLEEFQFDGFRFDGVTSMLYHDHGFGAGFGSYDDYFQGRTDEDAVSYLTLATQLIDEWKPGAMAIAEDVSGMPGLCAPREQGGCGFHYRLAMGIPDMWFKCATEIREEEWNMSWIWGELTGRRPDERTISYVESHDQAMVGGKSFLFALTDDSIYRSMHRGSGDLRVQRAVALHKMARLATLASAGHGYLNFMGNEFGHPEWIDFPREGNGWSHRHARRQWSLRDRADLRFQALGDFDGAIMALMRDASWMNQPCRLLCEHVEHQVLVWQRGDLVFAFHFHGHHSLVDWEVQVPCGRWELLLDSDATRFDGMGRVQPDQCWEVMGNKGSTGPLRLDLPSRTALVMQRIHPSDRADHGSAMSAVRSWRPSP
jgi:1,4-alpha-glucan branching enzyme